MPEPRYYLEITSRSYTWIDSRITCTDPIPHRFTLEEAERFIARRATFGSADTYRLLPVENPQ